MAKDTAEGLSLRFDCYLSLIYPCTERIIQTGKKKLVLDHVIVQKMDDDEGGGDVQSILTYGAKTLFEEDENSRDITCRTLCRF